MPSPTPSSPLVSAIITTKNEEKNIRNILESLKHQTYPHIEIVVIDNKSSDNTFQISKKYTSHVYTFGPERSAQRNFGVQKAKGKYVVILDADMVLEPQVIAECVSAALKTGSGGVIIPEKSFGEGYWAKVKSEERRWYVGDETIEAERFFAKEVFEKAGGYDVQITGPEDWDLPRRTRKLAPHTRINAFIHHNEGRQELIKMVMKKYYYAKKLGSYLKKNNQSPLHQQQVYFLRPSVYRNIFKVWRNPAIYGGIWIMLLLQTFSGSLGFIHGKLLAKYATGK